MVNVVTLIIIFLNKKNTTKHTHGVFVIIFTSSQKVNESKKN